MAIRYVLVLDFRWVMDMEGSRCEGLENYDLVGVWLSIDLVSVTGFQISPFSTVLLSTR